MSVRGRLRKILPAFLAKSGGYPSDETLFDYKKIWRYAILGTAVVSILPLIFMTFWNLTQFQKAVKSEIKFPISNLVLNAQRSLTLFLDERKAALYFIVEDNKFVALTDPKRLSQILDNLKIALGDIVDLGVITSDGIQRAYVGPYNLQGMNYKDENWFKEVTLRGAYISDVFLGFRHFPHIVIAVKHQNGEGGFYVLRMTLDTQKFNGIISSLNIQPSSDAFLVNDQGVIQTPSRYYGAVLDKISFNLPPADGQSNIEEIADRNGEPALLGYARIEGSPFTFLAVKQPKEMMKSTEAFIEQLVGFLVVSVVIILAVIIRVATIMVSRIHDADKKRVMVLHEIEHTNKMASIGRLAAGVAHEINNPLAIINEKSGLMKDIFLANENVPQKEKLLKTVDAISNSVQRCGAITYRLLGFARHIDVQIELIELKVLMEEVLAFLGKEAEYRNIAVNLTSGDDVPTIMSDRGQLQQVFLNIINNAFAAVSDGGRIDIEIFKPYADKISVSIKDNGVGIPPEHLQEIFEPFFTTKGRKGTGLGLSITYGIVQKLGGTVKVESKVNKGTKFTVTIPIVKP